MNHKLCIVISTSLKVFKTFVDELSFEQKKILKNEIPPDLIQTSDSSWHDCPDTARSTASYVTFHRGGIIDFSSCLPAPVSLSSMEAETVAASLACAAVTHYRYLEDEIINIGKMNFKLSDESKIPPSVILTQQLIIKVQC